MVKSCLFASVVASAATSIAKPDIVELAESDGELYAFVQAVVAGDLVDTLSSPGPYTVFAPTEEAFSRLPGGVLDSLMKPENKAQLVDILKFHVLPEQLFSQDLGTFRRLKTVEGKDLFIIPTEGHSRVQLSPDGKEINTVIVTGADNVASNGVVHKVDGVLLPPAEPVLPYIIEFAESDGELSAFVQAVVAGDLVDTLSSPGPYTVFAPTDEAFSRLPGGILDSLMKPENKAQLVDILKFHVHYGEQLFSKDLGTFRRLKTVEGKDLFIIPTEGHARVQLSPDGKEINTVIVTGADNVANNGVVHKVDGVLLPPSQELVV